MATYFEPSAAVVFPTVIQGGTAQVADLFPQNADPVTLACAAAGWTFGAWTTIVAANVLTGHTLIAISKGALGAAAEAANFQGQIGVGAAGFEVPIARFGYGNNLAAAPRPELLIVFPIPIQIPANARVSGRLECNVGGIAQQLNVYIHVLPSPF